jgi:nucleoside 2-deoxyribosyltransferase
VNVIEQSDSVIADVTSKQSNIYYELGLADAMRKPVLILAQKSQDVPPDFAGHRVLVYEPDDTEKLSRYLDYWIDDQSPKP